MDKEIIKYKNIASAISIGLLSLVVFESNLQLDLSQGYYALLKWIVTLSAIFLTWIAYKSKRTFWLFLTIITAILFNPLAPIKLDKDTWIIIDFVVAILFLASIFKLKVKEE